MDLTSRDQEKYTAAPGPPLRYVTKSKPRSTRLRKNLYIFLLRLCRVRFYVTPSCRHSGVEFCRVVVPKLALVECLVGHNNARLKAVKVGIVNPDLEGVIGCQ